jgi:hypothetical protein
MFEPNKMKQNQIEPQANIPKYINTLANRSAILAVELWRHLSVAVAGDDIITQLFYLLAETINKQRELLIK